MAHVDWTGAGVLDYCTVSGTNGQHCLGDCATSGPPVRGQLSVGLGTKQLELKLQVKVIQ